MADGQNYKFGSPNQQLTCQNQYYSSTDDTLTHCMPTVQEPTRQPRKCKHLTLETTQPKNPIKLNVETDTLKYGVCVNKWHPNAVET